MQTITKLEPKSIANLYGFFLALSAFLTGLGIALMNITNLLLEGNRTFMSALFLVIYNILFGIFIGFISAVAAAVVGYICGLIFAWLYNLCVKIKFIGGIKINLEQTNEITEIK
jgi:membrane associated rhomboid family serine protease